MIGVMDGTNVTDAGLKHLKRLPKLTTLLIQRTQITGSGFGDLPGGLKTLWMQRNTPVTDEGLRNLSHLKHLETLHLAGTQVTDEGLPHLEKLNSLRELYLATTTSPAARAKLTKVLPDCKIVWPR